MDSQITSRKRLSTLGERIGNHRRRRSRGERGFKVLLTVHLYDGVGDSDLADIHAYFDGYERVEAGETWSTNGIETKRSEAKNWEETRDCKLRRQLSATFIRVESPMRPSAVKSGCFSEWGQILMPLVTSS